MTATLSPQKSITHTDNRSALPPQYLWTREKYEHVVALGLLGPGDKVELIAGEIVQKLPQNPPHSIAMTLSQNALRPACPSGHVFRIQLPLSVGDFSQPEPNLAIVLGAARDDKAVQPNADRAVLVVEISDMSPAYDQTQKASMYARAGIADDWIVNLNERVLRVRRQPGPQEDVPFGYAYGEVLRLTEAEAVAPLAAVNAPIAVADLRP